MEKSNKLEEMEIIISNCLRAGVLLSAVIVLVGLSMFLLTGRNYTGNYYPTNPSEIFKGLILFKSYAIILTGLLVLILTPVFRVGVSIIVF
ncbi:MAG TPA: DUF1634 domain-containing protein [Clostridiaceae bacterium]